MKSEEEKTIGDKEIELIKHLSSDIEELMNFLYRLAVYIQHETNADTIDNNGEGETLDGRTIKVNFSYEVLEEDSQ